MDEKTRGIMVVFDTDRLQVLGYVRKQIAVTISADLVAEVAKRLQPYGVRFSQYGYRMFETPSGKSMCLDYDNRETRDIASEVAKALERVIRETAIERAIQMGRQDSYHIVLGPEDVNLKELDDAITKGKQEAEERKKRKAEEERKEREREKAIAHMDKIVHDLGGELECGVGWVDAEIKHGPVSFDIPFDPAEWLQMSREDVEKMIWQGYAKKIAELEKELDESEAKNEGLRAENEKLRGIIARWCQLPEELQRLPDEETMELAKIAKGIQENDFEEDEEEDC